MTTEQLLNTCHGVNGEHIRRTASDKVHMPGEPKDGIQRCIRCHARIDSSQKWQGTGFTPSFWAVGVPILARRSGASILTEAQAANFRPCGRSNGRPCAHEVCDPHCGQRGCAGFHRIHGSEVAA